MTVDYVNPLPIVLIVDDAVENLQVLSGLLKDKYRVKIAKNGEKAIELANATEKPNLILLDVVMPGMSGFEVCAQLKSDDSTKNIPVIFITALNESADETKGFSVGGADFISKPFHPEVVLARIQTHIELQAAKEKSDTLLKVLLPENVVNDLINNGKHIPEIHNNVSILFFDFVGFTNMTTQMNPQVLIEELSGIFTDFDEICSKHHATRIKTIGDAYMATTGLGTDDKNHAVNLVNTAIDFINYLNNRNQTAAYKWQCRIGVHSGSVIAGIIGKNRFAYDILGDDVNIAAKVESAGVPMKVTITEATKQLCANEFVSESIGKVMLKRRGEMELFVVTP
ncbi:MAG: adenylate/guanylate cyclase domain-containing protein [Bacteroidota bacterium]